MHDGRAWGGRGVDSKGAPAVLCEDAAACAGVVVVAGGMGASLLYATPVYDCVAGIAVGGLLGGVGGGSSTLTFSYLARADATGERQAKSINMFQLVS